MSRSLHRAAAILAWPFLFLRGWLMAVRHLLRRPIGAAYAAGEVLVVREPLTLTVLTHWRAPYTGGFTCTLPPGTRLEITENAGRRSKGLSCVPADGAEAFERRFAPEATRRHPKYAGCSLVLFRREIAACDRED